VILPREKRRDQYQQGRQSGTARLNFRIRRSYACTQHTVAFHTAIYLTAGRDDRLLEKGKFIADREKLGNVEARGGTLSKAKVARS
jgi:hypothetical protein